jgi:hypothetical protein
LKKGVLYFALNEIERKKIVKLIFIVILGILSAGGFGILFFSQLAHHLAKPSPSASTTGKIYETRPARRISRHSREAAQCSTIFEVNGKRYEKATGCSWYSDGDRVTVIYQTTDPYQAILDTRSVGYIFGFIGLALAFIAYLMIKSFRTKQQKIA